MKKILLLLMCACLLFSLAACGDSESPEETNTVKGWDPAVDHKVIMDDSATKILIADLDMGDDPANIDISKCIIWEWDTENATGAKIKGQKVTMDEAGFRYSTCWKRQVVIFCGSGGWVGAVDYMTKEVLFEDNPGNGPHSVEMLPNGDMVVACSGNSNSANGKVLYYELSKGKNKPSASLDLDSAHGICWDPTNEVIWVLGGQEIIACTAADGKLTKISGMGLNLSDGGGHDLSPVYGHPGLYWVSTGSRLFLFDGNENTLTDSMSLSAKYWGVKVKGIAWFPDGSMILTADDQGGTGTYRSSQFRILYPSAKNEDGTYLLTDIMIPHRKGSQTYKIHVFSEDYH